MAAAAATSAWRKLKKALKSKLSFLSASNSTDTNNAHPSASSPPPPPPPPLPPATISSTTSPPPPPPPPRRTRSSSTSSSFSSRLSRSFSLRSSSKTCAICLRSLKKAQGQAIFVAECSHPFHFNCIADNVKHGNLICPVCRSKWKDLPFQAPTIVTGPKRDGVGGARLSPINASSIPLEQARFSDDEALEDVFIDRSSLTQSQTITIKSFPEYPAVSGSDSLPKFGVLIRICAPPLDITRLQHRAPIDLVAVLDVSGSMATKLALLKHAVSFIIQNLGPSDRLSIVTFSSSAQRVLPLRRMSDRGREDALSVVNSLSANGGTSIVAGLKKGVRVLEERRHQNSVTSIILLSDGRDTHSSNSLNRLEYLKRLPTLICPANNALGEEEAPQSTIPVHTFGFGLDHDSIAMHAISDASGGTFSFIESIAILQDAFARCIGGLLSIVAQDVQLKVRSISPGVQISAIPSGKYKNKILDQGNLAVIDIGNLYAEEEKEFLAYLSIPYVSIIDGEERLESTSLLDILCLYRDSASMNMIQVQGERVVIRRPQILSATDKVSCLEVDRQRNRLLVTEAIASTQTMAEMGDLDGAQALLTKQLSNLLSTASAQAGDDLCHLLEAELRETRERMESRELYERSGRAFVLSGMSSHSWQRATTRGCSTTISSALRGNGEPDITTTYETPTMTSMVSKSQIFNLASRSPHRRLNKSCSFIDHH